VGKCKCMFSGLSRVGAGSPFCCSVALQLHDPLTPHKQCDAIISHCLCRTNAACEWQNHISRFTVRMGSVDGSRSRTALPGKKIESGKGQGGEDIISMIRLQYQASAVAVRRLFVLACF
jgi:hypothetical protein